MRENPGDTVLGSMLTEQPHALGVGVVTVVVTLVGLFGLILLVGLTWCCCAKSKSSDTDEDNEESSGFIARKSADAQGDSRHGDGGEDVRIPVEGMWGNDKNGNDKTRQSRQRAAERKNSEDNAISVKDRVRKFEKTTPANSNQVVNKRDGSKPGKKKPKSKAFEEFENSGIIIGMGNAPRKRQSDTDWEPEEEGRGSSFEYLPTDMAPLYPRNTSPALESGSRYTDEGDSVKEDEGDLFAGVERNTEILKSFRRAPPPRKHNKPRRKPQVQQVVPSGDIWDTTSKNNDNKKAASDISVTVDNVSDCASHPHDCNVDTDHNVDMAGSNAAQCGLWKVNHDHVENNNHNVNDMDKHDVHRVERMQTAHNMAMVSSHTDRWSFTPSSSANFKCPNDLAMDTSTDKVAVKVLRDKWFLQNNVQRQTDRPQSYHYGANNETSVRKTTGFRLSHNNEITPTTTMYYDTRPSQKSNTHENMAAGVDATAALDDTDVGVGAPLDMAVTDAPLDMAVTDAPLDMAVADATCDFNDWLRRTRSGSEKMRQPREDTDSSSNFNHSGADMRKWQSEHLGQKQRPLSEIGTPVWHLQQRGMADSAKQMTPTGQTTSQSAHRSAAKRSRISPTRQHSAPAGPPSAPIKYLETEI